eukprot:355251-Chlamydomonas_euryale.AAC.3
MPPPPLLTTALFCLCALPFAPPAGHPVRHPDIEATACDGPGHKSVAHRRGAGGPLHGDARDGCQGRVVPEPVLGSCFNQSRRWWCITFQLARSREEPARAIV